MKKSYIVEFRAIKDENKSTRKEMWETLVFIRLPGDLKKVLRKLYDFDDSYIFYQLDIQPVDLADYYD